MGCKRRQAGKIIATLIMRAKASMPIYTAPLATDLAEPVLLLKACIENRIAPMSTSHTAPTAVRTKKVILKMKS